MKKQILKIILCILILGCSNSKKSNPKKKVKSEFLETYFYDFQEEFSGDCDTIFALKNWKAYHDFKNLLSKKYVTTNMKKALLFSDSLVYFMGELKKSITISILNSPSFLARVHVLETQVLRFEDMAKIKAIKAKEASKQVGKIFKAHDAFIKKINDIYATQAFEKKIQIEQENFYLHLNQKN